MICYAYIPKEISKKFDDSGGKCIYVHYITALGNDIYEFKAPSLM